MAGKPIHGHRPAGSKSPEYMSWTGMRSRCNNPRSAAYPYYGGRGITVCDRWADFRKFLEDMGPRPAGCTLERKDNAKPYEPGNCLWATRTTQQNNTRFNHLVTAFGETKTVSEWVRDARCVVTRAALYSRLSSGVPAEAALTAPACRGRKLTR